DDTLLAVAGYSTQSPGMDQGYIRIFDSSSLKEIAKTTPRPGKPRSVAISPDSQFLALGTSRGAYIIPREKGSERRLLDDENNKEDITAITFSPDGTLVALGTANKTVYVFSTTD